VAGDLALLVLGFVLTTVAGGALGYYLQNRAWDHQNDARLVEAERAAAAEVFDELSTLMDKRLYRMTQVAAALRDESMSADDLDRYVKDYREVRYAWNDTLNRNLARTQTYFGDDLRAYLEANVYEGFTRAHDHLLMALNERRSGEIPHTPEDQLRELNVHVYELNVRMGRLIREGAVGRTNPNR
jgi:hypothetical protein